MRLALLFSLALFVTNLQAYQSEERLQGMLIGKVAQFISWENKDREFFTITTPDADFAANLSSIYANSKIQNREVKVELAEGSVDLSNTDVFYVSTKSLQELENWLEMAKQHSILTISDMRGFTDRDGMVQIFFIAQKPRLRINLAKTREANLQVQSTLLQISDVVGD